MRYRSLLSFLFLTLLTVVARAQDPITFSSDTLIATTNHQYEGMAVTVQSCTVTIDGPHHFYSLNVAGSGVVTHSAGLVGGLDLTIDGNLTVGQAARIDVSGKGYGPSDGPGKGGDNPLDGGGGGGAYGGEARRGIYGTTPNPGGVYGNIQQPSLPGSGGGFGYSGSQLGAPGGGYVKLVVGGVFTLSGRLLADGFQAPGNHGGGGSGGGVYVTTSGFAGNGIVRVAGGSAYNNYGWYRGGAGGGGRIAMYYASSSYSGIVATQSGAGAEGYAGAGTAYLQGPDRPDGELIVDNGNQDGLGTPIVGTQTFARVTVQNYGKLTPNGRDTLDLTVTGDMTIAGGGFVDASTRGFQGSQGPGKGGDNSLDGGGAGGSYGGEAYGGYAGASPSPSAPYGSITEPSEPGSGGGSAYTYSQIGCSGGGLIHLTVGGTLSVNGQLLCNGENSGNHAGAGSGGGILLKVGRLSGNGIISVAGGYAYNNYGWYRGGSGSGGRIAVKYTANDFVGVFNTTGGPCIFGYSGAGTLFLQSSAEPNGTLIIDNGARDGLGTSLIGAQTFDRVIVRNKGVLVPLVGQPLLLTVTGDCTVDGGVIRASGYGYAAKFGPGRGTSNPSGGGSGAGYGGVGQAGRYGTNPPGGGTYPSATLPEDFGSGGGDGYNGSYPGSPGGGAVKLTVNGTLLVNGSIEASGYGNNHGGGGSGGSILLRAGRLDGTGSITADGGSTNQGGAGGGGRIALYYVENAFSGLLRTLGGSGETGAAGDGTVYTEHTTSNLTVALAVSPTSLGSGQTAAGSVTLSDVAPAGGLTLVLTSANPAISVPPTIYVPEGESAAVFTLAAGAVTTATTGSVSARLYDQISGVSVTVLPWLSGLRSNPDSVVASTTAQGILTLALPAPDGGLTVALQSSDPLVAVPAQVTVPAGVTTVSFSVAIGAVTTPRTVTLKATYGGETLQTQVQANPAGTAVASLIVAPASVVGGNQATAVLQLTAPAPAGGVIVSLASSDKTTITMPSSARILPGRTSVAFTVATKPVTTTKAVVLSATLGTQKTATVIVRNTGISALDLFPDLIGSGGMSIGVVTLDSVPRAPVTVKITSDSSVATPDAQIVIPAGQTTGFFLIVGGNVTTIKTALITAKANSTQKSRLLTVTP